MEAQSYRELVVEGPLSAIKGFVAGILLKGGLDTRDVLFAHEHAIHSDSFTERVYEWIHYQNIAHLVVPEALHGEMHDLLTKAEPTLGFQLRSDRPVRSASFRFTFKAYTKSQAETMQQQLKSFESGARLSDDYEVTELDDPQAKGTELYTPTHEHEEAGKGTLIGDLPTILKAHQWALNEPLVHTSEIHLHHSDD